MEIDTFQGETQPMDINANVKISYGMRSEEPAIREMIMPVFSPGFAKKHGIYENISINDLHKKMLELPLITELSYQSNPEEDSWHYWARSFQLDILSRAFRRHTQANIAIMDVEFGFGITIGRSCITMDSLASGKLVGLQKFKLCNPCSYYLTSADKNISTLTFLNWFYEQARSAQNMM